MMLRFREFKWIIALGLACALALLIFTSAQASPAAPLEFPLTQPDGTVFSARQWGDEWNHGFETLGGYTILQMTDGWWVYARATGDGLLASSLAGDSPLRVGLDSPGDLPLHLRPTALVENPHAPSVMFPDGVTSPEYQNIGTQKVLVILAQYTNHPGTIPAASFATEWFGASNSIKDFYLDTSFNNLTLAAATESSGTANDGVVGWLTLGPTHPGTDGITGNEDTQIARDAVVAADPYINYAAFDVDPADGYISQWELHIFVIVAGHEGSYDASLPTIWAHNWFLDPVGCPEPDDVIIGCFGGYGGYSEAGELHGEHQATIGTFAHELGHDLSMPDLYDTNGGSAGVGEWSVMGSGNWNNVSGYDGSSPALLDAFLKSYQGWMTPFNITGVNNNRIIHQAETNTVAFRLRPNPGDVDWEFFEHSGTGEYFLIENRQLTGYDAGLPGCGLLIWHIDESVSYLNDANADEDHPLVGLEQADNLRDLQNGNNRGDAGDPYPGTAANSDFKMWTAPNSLLYSGLNSSASVHLDSTACGSYMVADLAYSVASPGKFSKASPEDTSLGQSTTVLLDWTDAYDTLLYQYCFDNILNDTCTGTWTATGLKSQTVIRGLLANTWYEWHAYAVNNLGTTEANAGRFYTFKTAPTANTVRLPLTVRPAITGSLIPNGNFEAGHENWEEYSFNGWELVMPYEPFFPVSPHGGLWEAWLGTTNGERSVIQQQVTVTAGAPYLEFYQKTDSDEGNCTHDHAYVAINGLDEYTRGLCGTDSAWFRSVIDLSDYIGTTITLEFRVETDASVSSSWFVDDVAFYSGTLSPLQGILEMLRDPLTALSNP
jgi:M6 family metalloprotease-like protein